MNLNIVWIKFKWLIRILKDVYFQDCRHIVLFEIKNANLCLIFCLRFRLKFAKKHKIIINVTKMFSGSAVFKVLLTIVYLYVERHLMDVEDLRFKLTFCCSNSSVSIRVRIILRCWGIIRSSFIALFIRTSVELLFSSSDINWHYY